jgi:5-methylcytosine-specific restriction protein A
MDILNLILALIALIIAILAYQKVGGVSDVRKQIDQIASSENLRKSLESLTTLTDALRERTTEAIEKVETTFRREEKEEKKEPLAAKPPKEPEEAKKRTRPSAEDFQSALDKIFRSAQQEGKRFVDVKSGDLHRSVGGYPGPSHRIPGCCGVMKRNMKPGDDILQQPPSGEGATLTIRFKLPR